MLKQVEKKDEDGNTIICTVDENGVEQGPFEIHFDDGSIEKGSFKDGKKDGVYEVCDQKGILKDKGSYKDGKRHGLCRLYYPDGKIKESCNYRDGEKDGVTECFRPDGSLYDAWTQIFGKTVFDELSQKRAIPHFIQEGFGYLQSQITQMAAEIGQIKELLVQEKVASQENERKLREEKRLSIAIGNLKGRLAMLSDPEFRKPIGKARTPERQAKVEEIVGVHRARTLLSRMANKALDEGDKELFSEIEKVAKPYALHHRRIELEFKKKRAERRAKKDRG